MATKPIDPISPEWADAQRRREEARDQRQHLEQEAHDDTPHLEDGRDNCDDWGTGEGRYHGRM